MATFPTAPYQWRNDPDCYISKAAYQPDQASQPLPQVLKWRKSRRFSGYLNATFEGSSFVNAKRNENPDRLKDSRYWAQIYHSDSKVHFSFPYSTYWVIFVGREALCNSQRPENTRFEQPFSPNLVIADRFETVQRVR